MKSWLLVSNRALQISSNHSRLGPPQSRANKHSQTHTQQINLSIRFICLLTLKTEMAWNVMILRDNTNQWTDLPHPGTQLQSSYSSQTQKSSVWPSETEKEGKHLLIPIKFSECTTQKKYRIPRNKWGRFMWVWIFRELRSLYFYETGSLWPMSNYLPHLLTDSSREGRLIFRQVLVRGFFEWMCLSSRWKKFTLSWKVSDPPRRYKTQITFRTSNTPTNLHLIALIDWHTNTHTNQCSCGEIG